jgi:hypothetical protein
MPLGEIPVGRSVYRLSASPGFILGFVSRLGFKEFRELIDTLVNRFCSSGGVISGDCVSRRFYDIALVFASDGRVLEEGKAVATYLVSYGLYELDWDQCTAVLNGDFSEVLSRYGIPPPPDVEHPLEACIVAEKIIEFFRDFDWSARDF